MRVWRTLPEERSRLFAPIGLRLLDAVSGAGPLGWIRPHLDELVGGQWVEAQRRVAVSGNGIVTVPRLGRTARPAQAQPRHYRLRVDAEHYRPLYRATLDGIEFDAQPYNDSTPPQPHATGATDTPLLPTSSYPFPSHLRVIRGVVRDPQGDPVADALVQDAPPKTAALSDERGTFALPLLAANDGTPALVNATHPRTGRSGTLQVTLPGDLGQNLTITVHP